MPNKQRQRDALDNIEDTKLLIKWTWKKSIYKQVCYLFPIAVSLLPPTNIRFMGPFKPIVATVTMVLLLLLWIITSWHMFHCTWLITGKTTILINHLKQHSGISPIMIPLWGKGSCLYFPTPEPASLAWIPVYGELKPCMAFDQHSMPVAKTPYLCYRSAGCDYKCNTNWL